MRFLYLVFLCGSSLLSIAQANVSVLTQHNDLNRTGWNNSETLLNHANVAPGTFGCIGTLNVDDEVYAQPLIVRYITAGNHTGSVLYVATVNNTVYAFNADDVSDTAYLWKVNLNPQGQRTPNTADLTDAKEGSACGGNYKDFSGQFGIVGTPVIDTTSNTLYVATKSVDNNGNFYDYLNALDLSTGQRKPGSPHLITAQIKGTGSGSVNGVISYQAKFQNQRPALLLYNNTVYVASASYCDWGPYHGWILGFDAATLNLKYTYNTTPNGWQGGIWTAGEGISVGQDGNLYVVSGNGSTTSDNNTVGGRSSSLIKLTQQLSVLDWFTPANYHYLDSLDLDYGCDGVLIVPNSATTVSGSKEGISYVVDYNNMGRYSTNNSLVKDTLEFNPNRTGNVHVHGSPVYAKLGGQEFVYGWPESYRLRQFTYQRNTGTFSKTYKEGNRTLDNGMPGAMLSLSSNGEDTSSAIVWACFPTSGNANNSVRPGTLAAYRANDVSKNELWNSDQNPNDVLGMFAKFNQATVANGKVYVPTFSKSIKVYGVYPADSATCTGNGTGLLAQYYSNTPSSAPFPATATISKTEPTVNFTWGSGGPSGISTDSFKVRFSGQLQSMAAGSYTIYVTSDDGYRLWVNDQLVIDKWVDKSASEDSATITLSGCTKNNIKLEYYENRGNAVCILKWKGPGIAKQVIPAIQLYPADSATCTGNGTGLLAQYYSNTASSAPFPDTATITKTEPTVNFTWGSGGPAGISTDSFKVRFSGQLQSMAAGSYTIYANSDDGYRLWVNNQLVRDRWYDKSASEDSVIITLAACTKNNIKLEYYENRGDAVCILKWKGPGIAKQVIPAIQLYPADSATCTGNGTGLLAQYYSNTPSSAPFPATATITKTEPTVNFTWGSGGPSGISTDSFKVRFSGQLQTVAQGSYTFYVTSDDGLRLWVNNQLMIDKWVDKSASEDSASITLAGCTKNNIKLEYYENRGDAVCILKWKGPGIAKQVIPATQLYPVYPADSVQCTGNGTGLLAQYYSNTPSSAPFPYTATITKTEPTVNFTWGSGGPAGISTDSFKVRFSGQLQSMAAGSYTIYVNSDDGYRLWVNNQLVRDRWYDKSASEDSVIITLAACTKNNIKLEYYENRGDAVCILKWKGPGIAKQVIPAIQLYPADSATCTGNGTGLLAQYYSNTPSSAPFPATATITKTEPTVNFTWGSGGPSGISTDSFKVRFSGQLQTVAQGSYTFYVTSDDGLRLWVNNQLMIDKWVDKSASEDSASITLAGCTKNNIKLEYYENRGDAVCILKWKGPGIAKQIIPATQLYSANSLLRTSNSRLTSTVDKMSSNLKDEFVVYPNPNGTHTLTVSIGVGFSLQTEISIYNIVGQKVFTKTLSVTDVNYKAITFPMNLPAGIYIIRLVSGDRIYSSKFIVL